MDIFALLIAAGATARLTRLAVVDDVAGPVRDGVRSIARRVAGHRGAVWAHGLLSCPFCIGFWISVAVAGSWFALGETVWWRFAGTALTLSYAAGHAVANLDLDEGTDE